MATPWIPIIRLFSRDRYVRILFGTGLGLALLSYVALFLWRPTGNDIPLHYNVYFGIDFIGSAWQLFWLPTAAVVLVVVDAIIALWIWRRDRMLSYFLAAGSMVVSLLLTVALGLVLQFNAA